jgi:hypothetical protein
MMAARGAAVIARRAVGAMWAALYASVLLSAPIAHATTEVAASHPILEEAHSDECARVHGGAACHSLNTLQLAYPSLAARIGTPGTPTGDAPASRRTDPLRSTASTPPPARAPPHP